MAFISEWFWYFLLIPLAAIFIRAIPSGALGDALGDPVIREALVLSLLTTSLTLGIVIVLGTVIVMSPTAAEQRALAAALALEERGMQPAVR